MNKVININIAGLVFHADEEAYEVLRRYLDSLKKQFGNTEGGDEILADIESRVAEMLTEKLKNRGEIISLADVQQVIEVMGKPEDMEGAEAGASSSQKQWHSDFDFGKR